MLPGRELLERHLQSALHMTVSKAAVRAAAREDERESSSSGSAPLDLVSLLLTGGEDLDDRFDELLPLDLRQVSRLHWTPVDVVRKAVDLFRPQAGEVFLDVGCGPGKFCLVGSLLSGATFHGIEQRPHLVEIARACANMLGAGRATFMSGEAFEVDWTKFAGVYLYNPFAEQLFGVGDRVDQTLPFTKARYEECVAKTTEKLLEMPAGTRVVLYHGFGGRMPDSYEREWRGFQGSGLLELWVKVGSERPAA
jgi:hypothetical protein